jgi:hypothetical protein
MCSAEQSGTNPGPTYSAALNPASDAARPADPPNQYRLQRDSWVGQPVLIDRLAVPHQRFDLLVDVPDVDVHAGQHAPAGHPERDELAAWHVATRLVQGVGPVLDPLVPAQPGVEGAGDVTRRVDVGVVGTQARVHPDAVLHLQARPYGLVMACAGVIM